MVFHLVRNIYPCYVINRKKCITIFQFILFLIYNDNVTGLKIILTFLLLSYFFNFLSNSLNMTNKLCLNLENIVKTMNYLNFFIKQIQDPEENKEERNVGSVTKSSGKSIKINGSFRDSFPRRCRHIQTLF